MKGDRGGGRRSPWAALARWTFLVAAAAALWNTLRQADLGRAATLVTSVGPLVALALLPFLVAVAAQTAGYHRILDVVGAERRAATNAPRASFRRLLLVMFSSEAVVMTFPAGPAVSDAIGPSLLEHRCGVPVPEGLAAVAAKKALIVVTNGLYILIAVALGASYLRSASRALLGFGGLPWMVAGSGVMLLVTAIVTSTLIFSGSIAARSHALLMRIPSARARRWLDEKRGGFLEIDRHFAAVLRAGKRDLVLAGALILAGWMIEGGEALVILRLLGVELSYSQVISFEVVVSLMRSMAFVVPAGLGVAEAGYVAFLGAFGVSDAATVGVAFSFVKRAKEVFWIAVGYLLFVVLDDAPAKIATAPRA